MIRPLRLIDFGSGLTVLALLKASAPSPRRVGEVPRKIKGTKHRLCRALKRDGRVPDLVV